MTILKFKSNWFNCSQKQHFYLHLTNEDQTDQRLISVCETSDVSLKHVAIEID